MEKKYGASRGVLQLAVEQLKRTGFVTSMDRQGMFVSDTPPHLKRYALVFSDMHGYDMSRFEIALTEEANRLNAIAGDDRFIVFNYMGNNLDLESAIKELEYEVANHLFAGVIFFSGTHLLADEKPFNDKSLGKVLVFVPQKHENIPIVNTDGIGMMIRAITYLKSKNRKRVAVLYMADANTILQKEDFEKIGLEYKPQWTLKVGRSHPKAVEYIIPLLMDYPPEERPDALFIADDNLVEYAVSSVISLGLQIGKDIDIVGHCNWPWPVPCMAPIERIGFNVQDLLKECLELIARQRDGEVLGETITVIPALFENEL
jgi:DNA-binding LacI/PurR family transcriptional regulator